MLISIVPFIVAIVGVLIYALASNAKAVEIGRIAYFSGLLVTLLVVAKHVVRIG